jgi:hypothetical protein
MKGSSTMTTRGARLRGLTVVSMLMQLLRDRLESYDGGRDESP